MKIKHAVQEHSIVKDCRSLVRILAILFIVACVAFSYSYYVDPHESAYQVFPETDDSLIIITCLNDVSLSWGNYLRGCDYIDGSGELLIASLHSDSIFSVNPSSGEKMSGIACPPEVDNVLGVVQYEGVTENWIYINHYGDDTDLWKHGSSSGWSYAFPNPAELPRGMDMDEFHNIWEVDTDTHILFKFDLNGTVSENWVLPGIPSSEHPNGCSVFPFGNDLGVIIGCYTMPGFRFYVYDGVTLEYYGPAPLPQYVYIGYDISYSSDRDSFFWLYKDFSDQYRLCEFTIQVLSLQQSTWAGVKSGF